MVDLTSWFKDNIGGTVEAVWQYFLFLWSSCFWRIWFWRRALFIWWTNNTFGYFKFIWINRGFWAWSVMNSASWSKVYTRRTIKRFFEIGGYFLLIWVVPIGLRRFTQPGFWIWCINYTIHLSFQIIRRAFSTHVSRPWGCHMATLSSMMISFSWLFSVFLFAL